MRHWRRCVCSLLVFLSVCADARAADGDEQTQAAQPPTTSAPPPKQPAPPLFPRHRRGTYRNDQGLDVVDATPQSPPLEIDDPGVPDDGEFEINLTTHADLSKDEQSFDLLFVDANYGTRPKIAGREFPTQVKFEFPVSAARRSDEPATFGIGPARLGLKINFYTDEQRGLMVSLYPQIEFAAPVTRAVEKGLAAPGQTLILPLLVSKTFHALTFVANAGVEKPLHDPGRVVAATFGVAFGRAITSKLSAMIEVQGESALDSAGERLVFLNGGVIRGVRNVVIYAKLGHSLASSEDVSHTLLGVGMKVFIQSKGRK